MGSDPSILLSAPGLIREPLEPPSGAPGVAILPFTYKLKYASVGSLNLRSDSRNRPSIDSDRRNGTNNEGRNSIFSKTSPFGPFGVPFCMESVSPRRGVHFSGLDARFRREDASGRIFGPMVRTPP